MIDETPSGRIHLDGNILVDEGEGHARVRRAMGFAGLIVVTLVLDQKGKIATDPAILFEGIPEAIHAKVREALEDAVRRHNPKRNDEGTLRETSAAPSVEPPAMPGAKSPSPGWRLFGYIGALAGLHLAP